MLWLIALFVISVPVGLADELPATDTSSPGDGAAATTASSNKVARAPILVQGDPCADPSASGVINCDEADGDVIPYIVSGYFINASHEACGVKAVIVVCGAEGQVKIENVDLSAPDASLIYTIDSDVEIVGLKWYQAGFSAINVQGGNALLRALNGSASASSSLEFLNANVRMEDVQTRGNALNHIYATDSTLVARNLSVVGQADNLVSWKGPANITNLYGESHPVRGGIGTDEFALSDQNFSLHTMSVWQQRAGHLEMHGSQFLFMGTAIRMGEEATAYVTYSDFSGAKGSVVMGQAGGATKCGLVLHYNDIQEAEARGTTSCTIDARHNWWNNHYGPETSPYAIVDPWLHRSFADLPRVESMEATPMPDEIQVTVKVAGPVDRFETNAAGNITTHPAAPGTVLRFTDSTYGLMLRPCIAEDCSQWVPMPGALTLPATQATIPVTNNGAWWWALLILPVAVVATYVGTRRISMQTVEKRMRLAMAIDDNEAKTAQQEMGRYLAAAAKETAGPEGDILLMLEVAAARAAAGDGAPPEFALQSISSPQIRSIVEQMAAFARAGHCELKVSKCDLAEVVYSAAKRVEQGSCSVAMLGPPRTVLADCEQVASALSNFVRNAVDAKPGGRIKIDWTGKGPVTINITDHGNGLPAPIVANPSRLHLSPQGLHVATARRLIKRLGGTCQLIKSDETGTHWRIILPPAGIAGA